jgi:hypothetical protein
MQPELSAAFLRAPKGAASCRLFCDLLWLAVKTAPTLAKSPF